MEQLIKTQVNLTNKESSHNNKSQRGRGHGGHRTRG